jgi:hypothetical protein
MQQRNFSAAEVAFEAGGQQLQRRKMWTVLASSSPSTRSRASSSRQECSVLVLPEFGPMPPNALPVRDKSRSSD